MVCNFPCITRFTELTFFSVFPSENLSPDESKRMPKYVLLHLIITQSSQVFGYILTQITKSQLLQYFDHLYIKCVGKSTLALCKCGHRFNSKRKVIQKIILICNNLIIVNPDKRFSAPDEVLSQISKTVADSLHWPFDFCNTCLE